MRARQAGVAVAERLRLRRGEIEQALLTRVYAISDPKDASDPTYLEGLHVAVRAALDYGIDGLAHNELRAPPILLAQARLAARVGVGLDTVLRRYVAGHALLRDFMLAEARRTGMGGAELQLLSRSQASSLDNLLASVSEEHRRESDACSDTSERHLAERVRKLLAGELLDGTELSYRLEGFHVAALATGPSASQALQELASCLDLRLLLVHPDDATVWAWLGDRHKPKLRKLDTHLSSHWPAEAKVALGEPAEGLDGWRLSHRQAKAALPIALRGDAPVVRYAGVALLATVLQDDLLTASLSRLYLDPLSQERDRGVAIKETLRAYFAAARNVSSTASALGVNRRTVASRLQIVEERLGRPLESIAPEIETALRLERLNKTPSSLHPK